MHSGGSRPASPEFQCVLQVHVSWWTHLHGRWTRFALRDSPRVMATPTPPSVFRYSDYRVEFGHTVFEKWRRQGYVSEASGCLTESALGLAQCFNARRPTIFPVGACPAG